MTSSETSPLATSNRTHRTDVLVIGAGAAGLFCAAMAGQRGRSVLLVDHAQKVAEKIRISGGGRCNFTNKQVGPENYFSSNPRFARSALSRYTPADFLKLLARHRIRWHEKHKGQLFCDDSAEDIITMLLRECDVGHVQRWQPCQVEAVEASSAREGEAGPLQGPFSCLTDRGTIVADQVVVATGGLSIPKIGATDFGFRLARQFGHRVIDTRPALVPLTFDPPSWAPYAELAGLSLPVRIGTEGDGGQVSFDEDLLFTHRGLSGPAVLQISTPWQPGHSLQIDLAPGQDLYALLRAAREGSRRQLGTELARLIPSRLAGTWLARRDKPLPLFMAEIADRDLRALAQGLQQWTLKPMGSEGYRKAEVTAGGVDTRQLDPASMESRLCPGLYFIGEVVDVTGWLGGYNFQWAWASAAACAGALADSRQVPL